MNTSSSNAKTRTHRQSLASISYRCPWFFGNLPPPQGGQAPAELTLGFASIRARSPKYQNQGIQNSRTIIVTHNQRFLINKIIVIYHPIPYHVGLDTEHLTHLNLDSHFAGEEGVRFRVVGHTYVYILDHNIRNFFHHWERTDTDTILFDYIILYSCLNVRARPVTSQFV